MGTQIFFLKFLWGKSKFFKIKSYKRELKIVILVI